MHRTLVTAAVAALTIADLAGCTTPSASSAPAPTSPKSTAPTATSPTPDTASTPKDAASDRDFSFDNNQETPFGISPAFRTDVSGLMKDGWTLDADQSDTANGLFVYRHTSGVTVRMDQTVIQDLPTELSERAATDFVFDSTNVDGKRVVRQLRRDGGGSVDFLTIVGARGDNIIAPVLYIRAFPKSKVLLGVFASGADAKTLDERAQQFVQHVSVTTY